VFAVLITILVLELKPPSADTFSALLPLWPTGLSYAVSYFFIAIVWINHHHLFSYAERATPRLVWSNFAHLFSVSLIPFTTEWLAESRLAAAPVAMYAAVFVIVNVTYLALCCEAVDRPAHEDVTTAHAQAVADEIVRHDRGLRGGGAGRAAMAGGVDGAHLSVSDRLLASRDPAAETQCAELTQYPVRRE